MADFDQIPNHIRFGATINEYCFCLGVIRLPMRVCIMRKCVASGEIHLSQRRQDGAQTHKAHINKWIVCVVRVCVGGIEYENYISIIPRQKANQMLPVFRVAILWVSSHLVGFPVLDAPANIAETNKWEIILFTGFICFSKLIQMYSVHAAHIKFLRSLCCCVASTMPPPATNMLFCIKFCCFSS